MKSFFQLLFALAFFLSGFTATSQIKILKGKVMDSNGQPLKYAYIQTYNKGHFLRGTETRLDGSYLLPIESLVDDSIVCSKNNYIKQSETIQGNNIINFILIYQPPAPPKPVFTQLTYSVQGTHLYTKEELKKRISDSIALIKELADIYKNREDDENGVFTKVEVEAFFQKGYTALQQYFARTINYPDSANISDVKGTVKIRFTIDKDGSVANVRLIKGVNIYCDSAVLNAIVHMPNWIPAMQNGRNIKSEKELSVDFNIKGIMPEHFPKEKKKKQGSK